MLTGVGFMVVSMGACIASILAAEDRGERRAEREERKDTGVEANGRAVSASG